MAEECTDLNVENRTSSRVQHLEDGIIQNARHVFRASIGKRLHNDDATTTVDYLDTMGFGNENTTRPTKMILHTVPPSPQVHESFHGDD